VIRRTLQALSLMAAVASATVHAGGWAVITLDTLPDTVEVGRATPLVFMVRQHGKTPLPGLSPSIQATMGARQVAVAARPGGSLGQYAASLILPEPGPWTITIDSGFVESRLRLLPITAVQTVAPGDGTPSAERGRRLFVAKGCVTCHQSDIQSGNASLNVGPVLVPQKYQADFLARVLADPAATLPPSQAPVGSMPNLALRPREIASLVAFINTPVAAARR
jgi:cytochrome c551/c552